MVFCTLYFFLQDKELIKSKLKPMKRKIEATTEGSDEPDAKKVKVEDDSKVE